MDNELEHRLYESFLEAMANSQQALQDGQLSEAAATASELTQITTAFPGAPLTSSGGHAEWSQTSAMQAELAQISAELPHNASSSDGGPQSGGASASSVTSLPEGGWSDSGTSASALNADSFSESPLGIGFRSYSSGAAQSGSGGGTASSVITSFLESGLGIVPLITGLFGLFGGGSSAPPPLEHYQAPSSILFESVDTGDTLTAGGYDQMGLPRGDGAVGTAGISAPPVSNEAAPIQTTAANHPSQQITVNVQAVDARSFLDRSDDIAQAVRAAMLNMSTINDVINEL